MGKFINTILCDAVYVDQGTNKAVLAGVYSGIIALSEIPGAFAAAIYSEYESERDGSLEIDLMIYVDGLHIGGAKMQLEGAKTDTISMIVVPRFEFGFTAPGLLEVKVAIDGGEGTTLISKKVELLAST